jgi:acyl-CoA thioesterase I
MNVMNVTARARSLTGLALAVAAVWLSACGRTAPAETATVTTESGAASSPASGGGSSGGRGGGGTGAYEIVFLGDSLTSGLGLLSEQAFPSIVQTSFRAEGYTQVETSNAGVSGDTSAGGLRRVEEALSPDTRILVIALGGNDALRGLTTTQTHDNLAGIIDIALARNVSVLLCGMEAPTNLGADYRDLFREIYTQLLRDYKGRIALLPFLLEGVAGNPAFNQPDGIHPTAEGARKIAELVYPKLRAMVDSMGGGH